MPNVTAIPKSQQNGDILTQFVDTTSAALVTYTYPSQQSGLIIENSGVSDIFVTVGSYTGQVIKADKKWQADVSFTSFSIRSDVNSQEFIATATFDSNIVVESGNKPITSTNPFADSFDMGKSVRGIDYVSNVLIAFDTATGNLHISENSGSTWSASKGWFVNRTANETPKFLRFKGNYYAVGKDSVDLLFKIWRTPVLLGDTPFTWSEPLFTLKSGVTQIGQMMNADDQYIYVVEYGDPVGGPSIYRSADGVTWEEVYIADPTIRHIHAIAPDPFNPGHVWVTCGDNSNKTLLFSDDYGATWETVLANTAWQSVQISFTKTHIWMAGDGKRATVILLDRATRIPKVAAKNYHSHIAVPGGTTGDLFYRNAFYGAVDPNTGIYYCVSNDASSGGNKVALFYLPEIGDDFRILDMTPTSIFEVYIFNNYIYSGKYRHPVLAF